MRRIPSKTSLRVVRSAGHRLGVALGAAVLTLAFFIVLPVMQTITKPPTNDLFAITEVDFGQVDPPPPAPPEVEEEASPEQEEAPPEMMEAETAPPALDHLEAMLNPGGGGGYGSIDSGVRLGPVISAGGGGGFSDIVSLGDLDQQPRPTQTPSPKITAKMRGKGPARVIVAFIVNEQGRVEVPKVWKSDNPLFDRAALDAIKKWRFDPGKKGGKAVRFRFKQPFAFPK